MVDIPFRFLVNEVFIEGVDMASKNLGYRTGKVLGRFLLVSYLLAAGIGVIGSIFGVDAATHRTGWPIWIGTTVLGILILRVVPRPFDVILLSPFAIWGAVQGWGLTYMMAGIIVGLPVMVVCLLSIGRK